MRAGLSTPHEPVTRNRVTVLTCDRASIIEGSRNGSLAGVCAGTGNVKGDDLSAPGAQESVIHVAGVEVVSRDLTERIIG